MSLVELMTYPLGYTIPGRIFRLLFTAKNYKVAGIHIRGQLPDCSRKSLSHVDMSKLSALLSMLCWTGAVAVAPYNVVLVIFDDLRPVLGAYGDSLARTPNLDAFAQGSTVFTRAYSQVSLFLACLSIKSLLSLLLHISKRCAHPAAIPC